MTKKFGPRPLLVPPGVDEISRRLEAAKHGPTRVNPADVGIADRFGRPMQLGEMQTLSAPLPIPGQIVDCIENPSTPGTYVLIFQPHRIAYPCVPGEVDVFQRVGMAKAQAQPEVSQPENLNEPEPPPPSDPTNDSPADPATQVII